MRRFLLHGFLFILPLLALFVPPLCILALSGEFASPQSVEAKMLSSTPVLYNAAYSNYVYRIKFDLTLAKKPAVLALGSSHVRQFRSVFFKDPTIFYNANGAIAAMSSYQDFVDGLGSWHPTVIIMPTDIAAFDPAASRDHLSRPNQFGTPASGADVMVESLFRTQAWWLTYADYFDGKYTLADVVHSPAAYDAIGLYARAHATGYTNDGSTLDLTINTDRAEQQAVAHGIEATTQSISNSTGYEFGSSINPAALGILQKFLADCQQKGIHVIGFVPPVPHAIYEKMQSLPNASYYQTLKAFAPTLRAVYEKYGFEFYDFSDITSYGGNDSEFDDAGHGSEKLYLRLFLRMARQSPALAPYVDASTLQSALTHATSSHSVFPLGAH